MTRPFVRQPKLLTLVVLSVAIFAIVSALPSLAQIPSGTATLHAAAIHSVTARSSPPMIESLQPDMSNNCGSEITLEGSDPVFVLDTAVFTAQVDMDTRCGDTVQPDLGAMTVTLYDADTVIASAPVPRSLGVNIPVIFYKGGNHHIKAVFTPGEGWRPSYAHVVQVVNRLPSTTSLPPLSSNRNPSTYGEAVTFLAVVTTPTGDEPTRKVKFSDGATTLGFALPNDDGIATFTKRFLAVGTHSITAEYTGDNLYAPSTSNVLTQIVKPASP